MYPFIIEAIAFIFNWVLVPVILIFIFRYGLHIMARAKGETQRISAQAGFGAGLIFFLALVATQLPTIASEVQFGPFPILAFDLTTFLIANLVGMVFLFMMYVMLPNRLIGVIVLILIATSTVGLYNFLLLAKWKGFILSATLGTVLGAHLHLLFFPKTFLGRLLPDEAPNSLPPLFFGPPKGKNPDQ